MGGTWDLGASFKDDPLFLLAIRSLRLFLWLRTMSSSSSSLISIRATTTWKVSRRESIKFDSRVRDFNRPIWCFTFLRKMELIDLGLERQMSGSYFLSRNHNFLWNTSNGQLNRQKVSLSQKHRLRNVYVCQSRVTSPYCLVCILKCARQGLVIQN